MADPARDAGGSASSGLSRVQELVDQLVRRRRQGGERAPVGGTAGLERELATDVDRIRARFPELAGEELAELEAAQRGFLERSEPLLRRRLAAGRDHDLASAAAAVALDLAAEGRPELAERLFSELATAVDDFELYAVVDFHQRWHGIARAAVSRDADEARRWILEGLATCRERVVPPALVAVGGLVASGKSTVARLVADCMNAAHIEADRIRRHLTRDEGVDPLEPHLDETVYREMLQRAEGVLHSDRPALLDACFPHAAQRESARAMARERGWPFLFIECRVDGGTARARLAERDESGREGSWLEIYRALERRWQDTRHLPEADLLVLDCTRPLQEIDARVRERVPNAPPGHVLP